MRFFLVLLAILALPGMAYARDGLVVAEAVCVDGPVITLKDLARADGPRAEAVLAGAGDRPLMASPGFEGARVNLSGPGSGTSSCSGWARTCRPCMCRTGSRSSAAGRSSALRVCIRLSTKF